MELPSEWEDVLAKIQGVFPGAIIAGGALRDIEYSKQPKDVDIFCPVEEYEDGESFSKLEDIFPQAKIMAASLYGREKNMERDVMAVYNYDSGQYKYDFIICKPNAANLENFDLSICQISFDGRDYKRTAAYKQTQEDRIIKVMNINRPDRQEKRLQRIIAKFPEFGIDRREGELFKCQPTFLTE